MFWLTAQAIVFGDREGLAVGNGINDDRSGEQLLFSSVTHKTAERTQVARRVESNAQNATPSEPLPPARPSSRKIPQSSPKGTISSCSYTCSLYTETTAPTFALPLVAFSIAETCAARYTGCGVWVWKMTEAGARQERCLSGYSPMVW